MGGMIGNRYETGEVLGKGGMGTVYRARDTRLGRDVALKVINTNANDGGDSARMLHREAQAIAQLHHPNIVTIYDYSGPDESPIYIAMELIEGMTLTQIMAKTKTLPDTVIMSVLYSVSSALAHAHEHKMIHRDIKPSNIMIERSGRVLLMDFGIAKSLEGPGAGHTQMRGTPNFMAPEQIMEQGIGTYTDIFALGSLVYTCASGVPPFMSKATIDTMKRIATLQYTPLKQAYPDVSSALDRLVRQCMRKETENRPSALDINKACRVFLHQKNVLNPPHHLALYMAKLLGIPLTTVDAPLTANAISDVPDLSDVGSGRQSYAADDDSEAATMASVQEQVGFKPKSINEIKASQEKAAKEQEKKAAEAESRSSWASLAATLLTLAVFAAGGFGFWVYKAGGFGGISNNNTEVSNLLDADDGIMEQKVTVRIIPNGMLYIDGMEQGFVKGTRDFMLKPGWYNLEARQRGLEPKKQEIKVVKGQDLTVEIDLTRR